jgi:hypothetical protein
MLIACRNIFRCQDAEEPEALAYLEGVRLSALMILYFHPIYILVIKILSSILISSALIHSLYHHLSTVWLTCHFI